MVDIRKDSGRVQMALVLGASQLQPVLRLSSRLISVSGTIEGSAAIELGLQ
jgi:hypothetical protein